MIEETKGYGVQKLTVSNVSIGVTIPTGADDSSFPKALFVTVEADAIRFRYDGTAPTATDGHKVDAGGNFTVEGHENVVNFRMIRVTGDATVQVTFER